MATAQEQQNLKVVIDGFIGTVFNDRQHARAEEFLSPDFIKHPHDGAPDKTLPVLLKEFADLATSFPDLKSVVKKSIASGDYVWIWTQVEGTPEDFDLKIVEICRLEGGRVVEKWDIHQQTMKGVPV